MGVLDQKRHEEASIWLWVVTDLILLNLPVILREPDMRSFHLMKPNFSSRPPAGSVADSGEAARGGEALCPWAPEADVRAGAAAAPAEAHPWETLPPAGRIRPPSQRRGRSCNIVRPSQAHAALEWGQVMHCSCYFCWAKGNGKLTCLYFDFCGAEKQWWPVACGVSGSRLFGRNCWQRKRVSLLKSLTRGQSMWLLSRYLQPTWMRTGR